MKINLNCLVFLISIYLIKCKANGLKYQHIGDCTWSSDGVVGNEVLTFICYEHQHEHEDRFFNYAGAKKPCLNNKDGYLKDSIGQIQFQNCEFPTITKDIIEYYRFIRSLNISDLGLTSLSKINFSKNYGKNFRTLLASHNNLMKLEAGLLDNAIHLTEVDFSFNKIILIDSTAFTYSNALESLDLSSNYVSQFEEKTFDHLQNLKILILRNNSVGRIDSSKFSGLKSLTNLDLSYNTITQLNASVFDEHLLTILNLSHNKIIEISSRAFGGLNQLMTLDLSYNRISKLDNIFGHTLPALTKLDVSHNRIESISALGAIITSSSKLTALDMSANLISEVNEHDFDSSPNLIDLNLSFNSIKSLKSVVFAKLTRLLHLNLSNMNLAKIEHGLFFNPSHLQTLDLSRNRFERIDFSVFLPSLSELLSLYIDGNAITDIIGFRQSLFPQLTSFGIQDNNFNCSYLRFFFETMVWQKLNIRIDRTQTIRHEHVGGIKCVEHRNDPIEISTDSDISTLFVDVDVRTSTLIPETLTSSSIFPTLTILQTSSSTLRSTSEATTSKAHPLETFPNNNVELLMSVLCIILIAFLIFHIIINRQKICGKCRVHKRLQDHYSMAMSNVNSESTVAFAAK